MQNTNATTWHIKFPSLETITSRPFSIPSEVG